VAPILVAAAAAAAMVRKRAMHHLGFLVMNLTMVHMVCRVTNQKSVADQPSMLLTEGAVLERNLSGGVKFSADRQALRIAGKGLLAHVHSILSPIL
jgi:hypothetical protein